MLFIVSWLSISLDILFLFVDIRGDSPQEIYMNLNQDGHLRTGFNSPKCAEGSKIQLTSYNYQYRKCINSERCMSSSIIPFSVKQEHLIHRLCSFKESCSDLSLLVATSDQKEKSNAVFLMYQCLGKYIFPFRIYLLLL